MTVLTENAEKVGRAIQRRLLEACLTIISFDTCDEFRNAAKRRFNELNLDDSSLVQRANVEVLLP